MSLDTTGRQPGEPLTEAELGQASHAADEFQRMVDALRSARTVGDLMAVDKIVESIDIDDEDEA